LRHGATRPPEAVEIFVAWQGGVSMKTTAEYRAMAEECFRWAGEAYTDEVRQSYLQLAQIWLDAASKVNGLPTTRTEPSVDKRIKAARSAG
jgi:hypothetical protein